MIPAFDGWLCDCSIEVRNDRLRTKGNLGPMATPSTKPSAPAASAGVEFLTKQDLARRLNVSVRSIENWSLKERRIPYLKISRAIRFDWGAVRAALAKHQVDAVQ